MQFHKEVEEIRLKVLNHPWPKFLESIQLDGIRGWTGSEVRLQFPVCVVAGENGSGKSTILKAAAAIYVHPDDPEKNFYPSNFFPDTAWDSVRNASLKYKIREGTTTRDITFKKAERWRFPHNRPKRHVYWLDISRTLPINATIGYAYIAKRTALETTTVPLTIDSTSYFSSIMGRKYQKVRFATTDADPSRSVGVVDQSGTQYSQFHQGAGEDATLDMMSLLQAAPDTSLVIIDEVEASLHPRAQRRLVHYLLWLARTKQMQILLSTHSPFIIEEVPPEGRIFLERVQNGVQVIYGVTPKYALGRMDDYNPPEFYVFTEDVAAAVVVKAILRHQSVDLSRLAVLEVGAANVVATVSVAMSRRNSPIPALGVLDPDQQKSHNCISLPGRQATEVQVISDIASTALRILSGRLGIPEETLRRVLENASTKPDHHLWVQSIADAIGLSQEYVWETMADVWVASCLPIADAKHFSQAINDRLPKM